MIFICISFIIIPAAALAQVPPGRDAGTAGEGLRKEEETEMLKERLVEEQVEPSIEEKEKLETGAPEERRMKEEARVYIEVIRVEGVTIIGESVISQVVSTFEGRELSLEDFAAAADCITAEYRKLGYVTSFAYVPPQKITDDTLVIQVQEGTVGDVSIENNRFFTDELLLNYLDARKDDIFNYDALRDSVNYINRHPDRSANVVLARGEERGSTDVNINLEDRLPLHAILGYNNFNSRYVNRNKYFVELQYNNFLGLDHRVSGEFQQGHTDKFHLASARYTIPINRKSEAGLYYIHLDQDIGKELEHLNIHGEGDFLSLFYSYELISNENLTLSVNPGFEWKDIENKLRADLISEDKVRIAKLGLDLDVLDPFKGRTIITTEFDFGIEDFLDGMDQEDVGASRAGAGGKFFRVVTNAARVQELPHSMSLMLRGAMQLTGDDLVAAEQFSIGGMYTVRGYPLAEASGDRGYTFTSELYLPPFFLPKDYKIPYTETALFDALRFMFFIDCGYVENQNPLPGEKKDKALFGFGPAVRFEIPQKLTASFDYGIAIGHDASDGTDSRAYVEVKTYF